VFVPTSDAETPQLDFIIEGMVVADVRVKPEVLAIRAAPGAAFDATAVVTSDIMEFDPDSVRVRIMEDSSIAVAHTVRSKKAGSHNGRDIFDSAVDLSIAGTAPSEPGQYRYTIEVVIAPLRNQPEKRVVLPIQMIVME
jgi:hypothetical protein